MKKSISILFSFVLATASECAHCIDLNVIKGGTFVFNEIDHDNDIGEGCVYTSTTNYTFVFYDRLGEKNNVSGQVVRDFKITLNAQNRKANCPRGSTSKTRGEIVIYGPNCFDYIINDEICIAGDCGKDRSGDTMTGNVRVFDSGNKIELTARDYCGGPALSWEKILRRIP